MNTEESKKVDNEVSITRRAAIKAGWAVPVILAIGLGGNAFVHATPANINATGNPNVDPQGKAWGVKGGKPGW